MKSWAVTRGPSLVPGEKRLAVETEDHPVEYNAFEGTIPKGEYGGGTVMIWDRGTWTPEEDPHRGLKKGHLDLSLEGEKLHGRWHLVRLRGKPGEKRNNWLLIKATDDAARTAKDADILEEMPDSVISGRSIEEIAAGKGKKRVWHSNKSVADNVKAGATRGGVRPAKKASREGKSAKRSKKKGDATLRCPTSCRLRWRPRATRRRMAAHGCMKSSSTAIERRRGSIAARSSCSPAKASTGPHDFQTLPTDVARLAADTALIDGEIVVENSRGVADFSMLQAALSNGERDSFVYYVFDLLHLDGEDLSRQPLIERKAALKELLDQTGDTGAIRYSEHFTEDGSEVWAQACRMSLEGIVSKLADAPYRTGRSDSFIKVKCHTAQEVVVGGFAPSTVEPRAIGALVAGYYRDGKLIYAGRVGTGYTRATARELWKRLHPLEIAKPPFDEIPPVEARARDVRWVEPKTVIEAHFRGWTSDGIVRQAAFKGVREDKPANEVVREVPAGEGDPQEAPRRAAAKASGSGAKKSKPVAKATSRSSVRASVRSRRRRRPLHPSGSRLLGRCRRHQAEPRRLLHVGVGSDGAAGRERAVEPAAVPRRHRRSMLLPEARLGRSQRRDAAQRHRQQAPAGDRGREPRRAVVAGAGRRARSACARLDDRPARSLPSHRVRHRPGPRRRLGRYRQGRARRARAARRPSTSKAS